MNQESYLVYKALIETLSSDEKEKLTLCLTQEARSIVEKISAPKSDFKHLVTKEELFSKFHPSWIALWLRSLSKKKIQFILSAFQSKQKELIKDCLRFSSPDLPLTELGRQYAWEILGDLFYQQEKNLPPIDFLPNSPLFALWNEPYSKLQELNSLLGMYDVALELKKIIDNSLIKKLLGALTPLQQKYLEKRLFDSPGVIFKPMGLAKWDENTASLQKAIHNRGINRIAKALYYIDPPLRRYILFRYSLEEVSHIEQLSKALETKRAGQLLQEQIVQTLQLHR